MNSDVWTAEDKLGYRNLILGVAQIITHEETLAPLTIGIKAPWGAGKTSLMKSVQYLLDGEAKSIDLKEKVVAVKDGETDARKVQGLTIRQFMGNLKRLLRGEQPTFVRPKPTVVGEGAAYHIPHRTTIWFNAWKYQRSEQIWAGLAYSIIYQVASRMSMVEREAFYFHLNAKRFDLNKIRKEVYIGILNAFWKSSLTVATALIGGIVWLAYDFHAIGAYLLTCVSIGSGILGLINGMNKLKIADIGDGVVRDFIRMPDYEGRMGFMHLVDTDMKRVIDLVADEKQPLVIFIDDLDRCDAGRIAEIVGAINTFLASVSSHCIFVLGLEPSMVAAALECAYSDIGEKRQAICIHDNRSPLGWKFMDKIIQLSINIPKPTESGMKTFIDSLRPNESARLSSAMHVKPATEPKGEKQKATASEIVSKMISDTIAEEDIVKYEKILDAETDAEAVRKKYVDYLERLDDFYHLAALKQAFQRVYPKKLKDVDPFILEHIRENLPKYFADYNPRQLKRYDNLVRFLSILNEYNGFDNRLSEGREEDLPNKESIAKYVVLCAIWPQAVDLMRLYQWSDDDDRNITFIEIMEKEAHRIQETRGLGKGDVDESWSALLIKLFDVKNNAADDHGIQHAYWLRSPDFRRFLGEGVYLSKYIGKGLW